ncbi:MAG: hypothetical protein F4X57_10005 [Chloroflexi bacterium]|nr:hypothetical protein [Chloroflexota bacterium]
MKSSDLFESAIEWLQQNYSNYRFYTERDIVWTVQTHLNSEITRHNMPHRVFNDYTLLQKRRADLVILNNNIVEIAAEFKYEPSHNRNADLCGDIPKGKFPVVSWTEVEKDIHRVKDYVSSKYAKVAYSILIDEGKWFRRKPAPVGSEWIDWMENMSILWSKQQT